MKKEAPASPDPFAADLRRAEANADPTLLRPGTRAALPKRFLQRLLRVYTAGQVAFNGAVLRLLGALEARAAETSERTQEMSQALTALGKALAALGGRLADVERLIQRLGAETGNLTVKIDRISPATNEQMFAPGAHAAFESQFRGSREEILERQKPYVSYLRKAAQAIGPGARFLDLGCGRGELLELARGAGLAAAGVDSDPALVEACRALGLDARSGDLFDALWAEPEEALAGVTAIQVVEHLPWAGVRTLVDLAYQRIRRGGCLILETINPSSAYAMRTFYVDPTHRQPVPSEMSHFLLAQAGFRDIETRLLNPVDDPKLLAAIERDERLRAVADLLFGYRDYAVLGWKT
ncbi:MAG TPA: methyltransferase domain-containing protein [Thermoanaerobaculia bacterium]|nr:methyltransferase domain-containing protein [Thermoanaerobaculia bacterium]